MYVVWVVSNSPAYIRGDSVHGAEATQLFSHWLVDFPEEWTWHTALISLSQSAIFVVVNLSLQQLIVTDQ